MVGVVVEASEKRRIGAYLSIEATESTFGVSAAVTWMSVNGD